MSRDLDWNSAYHAPIGAPGAASLYNDMHAREFWAEHGEELQRIHSFSEYAAYAPVVPVRQSPLELHSLASLLSSAVPGVGVAR